jgi:ABC-type Mn2+/Zn2+ transport system permease subunit
MQAQEHSTVREGLSTGLLGAIVVAVWYLLCDLISTGHPLETMNVLGRIFLQGDVNPGARSIDLGAVTGFAVFHFVVFVLMGLALAKVTHLASRNLSLRMGVWIGVVVAFLFLTGLVFMLNVSTGNRLPLWEVLGGSVLGVGVMGWRLWRLHPRLGRSFDQVPLGDEVRSPPHAPGGPRV